MNETRYSLLRDEVSRKVIAWLLVMAMILGLVPSNYSIVAKAAEAPTLKLYVEKPSDWTTPVVHVWNNNAVIDGNGTATITAWGQEKTKLYKDETSGLYFVNVTNPNWTGFQFVNAETAAELKFDDAALLKKFNETTEDVSYYYLKGDKEAYAWYTDAEGKNKLALEEIAAKEEYYLVGTISPIGWNAKSDNDAKLSKNEDGTYSITIENVEPGKQELKVLQDPDNFAWKYAWGGTGADGNYVLELKTTSKVTITMDPADTKKQLVVVTEASEVSPSEPVSPENPVSPEEPIEEVKSPVYADGKVTFNLVTKASVAGIKGAMIEAWSKTVPMEKTSFGFTYSMKVPEPGIYDYGMATGATGGTWEGDPLNGTRKANGGNPVIVSNPIVGNGESYVYLPSTEENLDAKVLYKTKEEKTYKEVKFEKAEGYDNLYVATLKEAGTYEYLVKIGDEEAAKDAYNFTEAGNEIVVKKEIKKPEFTSPVLDEENGKVTFNYWAPDAKEVLLAGSMTSWAAEAVKMKKDEETGLFSVTLDLSFGSYQYKYVADGAWVTDPANPETKDGNSAFTFGTLEPQVNSETGDVTFTYYVKDYAKTVEKTESVKLMGLTGVTYVDENGKEIAANWDTGLDMAKNKDGNYTITIKNMPAGQYEYKFKANNATWLKDKRNPDGDDNSVVTVPGVVVAGDNIAGAGVYTLGVKVLGDAKTADEGSVKFSMAEPVEGMSITKDGVLTVTDAAKTGYFTVKLEYTANKEAKSSTSQFYYTENAVIYEYVPTEGEGLHAQMDKADVYTWNNAATGSSFHFKNIGTEENAK